MGTLKNIDNKYMIQFNNLIFRHWYALNNIMIALMFKDI